MLRTRWMILFLLVALTAAGAALAAREIPPVTGTTWAGLQKFRGSLKGAGKARSEGIASLEIALDGDFTYTDPDANSFSGQIFQDRKKLEVIPDPSAIGNLEDQLAALIESELAAQGIDAGTVTVTLDLAKLKVKAKLKLKKTGNFIQFRLSGKYTADSTTLGAGKGAFKTKGMLAQQS